MCACVRACEANLFERTETLSHPHLFSVLSCVCVCHTYLGGVQQLEALSSLLQQTQQLQQLQAIQQRLANGNEVGGAVGGVPAQMSNVESVAHDSQPAVFNEVNCGVCVMCCFF